MKNSLFYFFIENMLIFLALIIGIIINYFTGGFEFNNNLCIVAGIFLIMPSLLNFKLKDLIYFKEHKKLFILNLIFNFFIIPLIFLGISYLFFGNSNIIWSFLLLGLIPGGGLLISWVMKTSGNIKLAFSLFLVNLFIFSFLFIPYGKYLDNIGNKIVKPKNEIESTINVGTKFLDINNFGEEDKKNNCVVSEISEKLACPVLGEVGASKSAFIALFVLIIFPFLISRIILFFPKITDYLKPKIKIISTIATFFIISYIFSIKEVHNIFLVSFFIILKIFLVLFISYFFIYLILYYLYKKNGANSDANAFFWNSATRFLTLGLIFSFFYVKTFGVEFLLVFVVAYFIQVIGSNILFMIMKK